MTASDANLRMPLLVVGAVAGLTVAATGLFEVKGFEEGHPLPAGNIARVGETLIPVSRYEVLLDDLHADKRNPLSDEDRKFAVERLIDEELLIQRGVELGFTRDAAAVRKAIAAAVVSQVVAGASTTLPDDAVLQEFYASTRPFFTTPGRYRVRWWKLEVPQQAAAHSAANDQAPGSEAEAARLFEEYGYEAVDELPDTLLPASKLLGYLGPLLLEEVTATVPGAFSQPVHSGDALHVFYLLEHEPAATPAFDSIKDIVAREYMYRAGDKALRDYLAWLRERTPVVITDNYSH